MDSRDASVPTQSTPTSQPPGMMLGHGSFAAGAMANAHSTPTVAQSSSSMIPNPRFPFNYVITPPKQTDSLSSHPFDGASAAVRPCGFPVESSSGKKKRGRPRKYAPDGNIALGLLPSPISSSGLGDSGGAPSNSEPPVKRHRGRPPGSGKRQLDALGAAGVGFTPHVILVKAGEDIASKILAFSQQGPRTVCILSANGAICNITLRQPTVSGGTVLYEGRFEIISLSGSFLPSENGESSSGVAGIWVSLAGPDGRVLGGGVSGKLMAVTQVQVIVGSFIADGRKSTPKRLLSGTPQPQMLTFGQQAAAAATAADSSPHSADGMSESSDGNVNSPPENSSSAAGYVSTSQPVHGMHMYSPMLWANSTMKILPH